MKSKTRNDFFWKLFSVFCAVVLWLVVINIENPVETRLVRNINIEYRNINLLTKENLVITDKDQQTVDIKVSGKRLSLDKLKAAKNQIRAFVDMKYYSRIGVDNPNPMIVQIELPDKLDEYIEVIEQTPEYTNVVIQENSEIIKKIKYELHGDPKKDYEVIESKINLMPDELRVFGAQSLMSKLSMVKVDVDINGLSKSTKANPEVKYYDESGNQIEGIDSDIDNIIVDIPILKRKELDVKVNYKELAQEYEVLGLEVNPEKIIVAGDDKIIDSMGDYLQYEVSLKDKVENTNLKKDVKLPDKVLNLTGINKVDININIDKKKMKQINIKSDDLEIKNLQEGLRIEFIDKTIEGEIVGAKESIDMFAIESNKPYVDLEGFTEGEYEVPIKLNKTKGIIILDSTPKMKIKLVK